MISFFLKKNKELLCFPLTAVKPIISVRKEIFFLGKVILASIFFLALSFSQFGYDNNPLPNKIDSEWNIRLKKTQTNCDSRTACFNIEMQSANSNSWALGDQNYRLFFDGDLMTVSSVNSLLPITGYSAATIGQNVKITGRGQEAASPLDDIDDHLGFLDFTIIQNDKSNPANAFQIIPNSFRPIAEICVDVDVSLSEIPGQNQCLAFYTSRSETVGGITNQFTVISENDAPGSTTSTSDNNFEDFNCNSPETLVLGDFVIDVMPDTFQIGNIGVFVGNFLQNDLINTSNIEVTLLSQPTLGTVTLLSNQSFIFQASGAFPTVDQFVYQVCTGTRCCDTATITILPAAATFPLAVKIFLQGAMLRTSDGLMRDDLRRLNLLPLRSPYADSLRTISSLLSREGPDAPIDWVFVETRSALNPELVLESKSGLLLRNGNVVAANGGSLLFSLPTDSDSIMIAVQHRNHLGVMTRTSYKPTADNILELDFTDLNFLTYGNHAQDSIGGIALLWAGDLNQDGKVIFQGKDNENVFIFQTVLSDEQNTEQHANFIKIAYHNADLDLDGSVINQGRGNERSKILRNILMHPGNVLRLSNYIIIEQLP